MALQIPRPVESAFPQVRVPTQAPLESFGGGESTAHAMGATRHLAQQASALEQEKLETALQTAADEAMNQISAEETRLTVEMQKAKGKDAFAASQQALKDFDKYKGDLTGKIGNQVVKQYVGMKSGKHREQLMGFGMKYSNAEGERWQDATDQASWENHRNAAIANGSPERVQQAIDDTNSSLEKFASRRGMPPEWLANQKAEKGSAIHYGILSNLAASGNDLAAKAYFDAHKSELVGNDLLHATARVKRDSTLGEALRITDALFTDREDWTGPPGEVTTTQYHAPETMEHVRKETSKIESPELRAMVESQAKVRLAERKADTAATYNKNLEEAQDLVERTGSTKGINATLRTSHIRELERRAFEIRSGEKKVMTDSSWAKFNEYMDMAASPESRNEFLAIPPVEYRNLFPDAQFNQLREMRTGLLKDDKHTLSKLESHRTDSDFINDGISQLGLVPVHGNPLSADGKKEKELFERVAREQFTFYTVQNKGKPLDNAAREKIMDKLIEKAGTDPSWWQKDTRERGYRAVDKEYNRRIIQMEAGEQILIEEALRRAGEPVTRGRVIEIWEQSYRKRR